MLGAKLQREYAVLAVAAQYLNLSKQDDVKYLTEAKLSVKRTKKIKEVIALKRKILDSIVSLYAYNKHHKFLIDERIPRTKAKLLKALKGNAENREKRGGKEPVVTWDRIVYMIIKSINRDGKYQELYRQAEKLLSYIDVPEENTEEAEIAIRTFVLLALRGSN